MSRSHAYGFRLGVASCYRGRVGCHAGRVAALTCPWPRHTDLMGELEDLRAEVERLRADLDEARAWARGFEHGMFVDVDTTNPPEWLTAPLEQT